VETLCSLFRDNAALCSEVTERVVQHAVRCIETHGRHMQYVKFLQTIVKSENAYIRKCQDMVMSEVLLDPYNMYWLFLRPLKEDTEAVQVTPLRTPV